MLLIICTISCNFLGTPSIQHGTLVLLTLPTRRLKHSWIHVLERWVFNWYRHSLCPRQVVMWWTSSALWIQCSQTGMDFNLKWLCVNTVLIAVNHRPGSGCHMEIKSLEQWYNNIPPTTSGKCPQSWVCTMLVIYAKLTRWAISLQ